MLEKQHFLQNLKKDIYSPITMLKLYQLINFKSWKPTHVKIPDPDIELAKGFVNEYYTDQSIKKSILIQNIKKAINLISELDSKVDLDRSHYVEFIIFGCATSSDIDVGCVVRKCDQSNGKTFPLAKSEISRLKAELESIGYDISRPVDVSEIFIDESYNVVAVSKGTKEIQNMICATYHLHKQKYPCPVHSMIDIEPFDKIRGLSKFLLDNLYDLVNPLIYSKKEISSIKKQIYLQGSDKIIQFAKGVTSFVDFTTLGFNTSDYNILSILKSLVMKYIQTILLSEGEYSYSKPDLAIRISKYIPESTECAMYFLFRGRMGTFNENFIIQLHNKFVSVANDLIFDPIYSSIDILHIVNPTNLDDKIFNRFITSPINPTKEFEELWSDTYSDSGLNSLFVSKASNPDLLFAIKNAKGDLLIHLEDRNRFLFVDPKSIEWIRLISIYKSGSNSKIISNCIESKYNLIRGAIGEAIIAKYLDLDLCGLSDMKAITIGLIVENIIPGSRACCPDLILASGNEIIPVEIKCLKSLTRNKDYYRGISLAKRQCVNTIEILGSKYSHLINRYLIIIVGWTEYKIQHCFFNC
jgi:hypothetical protein